MFAYYGSRPEMAVITGCATDDGPPTIGCAGRTRVHISAPARFNLAPTAKNGTVDP
jgi:hypothetical protein